MTLAGAAADSAVADVAALAHAVRPTQALVHVPYLLSLIPFFGSSFDSIGGQPDTTPLYHTEGSITFVMQQAPP